MSYGCLFIVVCSLLFRQSKGNSIVVTNTSGIITSPNYPSDYNNDLDCEYIIQSPTKQPITLVFEDFDIEDDDGCTKDYVSVKDGANILLGTFCGDNIPYPLLALSGVIILKFHSNNEDSEKGFRAVFNDSQECVYVTKDSNGTIQSPNYPDNYPKNTICLYYIESRKGVSINMTFTHFALEYTSRRCPDDYVLVRDGLSQSSKQIGKFCGSRIPFIPVLLTGTVFIIFRSNNLISWSGFKADYEEKPFLDCSGFLNVSLGRIQSPKHPELYDSNTDCVYTLACQCNCLINLTFAFFEMEKADHGNCTYDFVEIYDSNTSIGKFCGFQKPGLTFILSNSVRVHFHSDDSKHYRGFSANFAEITVYQTTDDVLTTVPVSSTPGNMWNNKIAPYTNISSVNPVVIGVATGGLIGVIAVITIICVIAGRQKRTKTNRTKRHCIWLLQFLFLTVNLREAAVSSNVYTKLGRSAEMKCPQITTSSETAWFRSDHISQISIGNELNEKIDQHRFKIIGNNSTKIYNLKILNVLQSDFGEYSCSITDGNVSQLFTLNLIQLRPPIGMHIYLFHQNEVTFHSNIAGSDRITANEGETIHLLCNINSGIPEESLMWFYKGKILNFGGPGSLTLKLTLLSQDSGRYVCKANSSALEEAMIKTVNIDVLYKPRVSLSVNSTLHIVEGSSLTVYCNVKSNPEILNVTWWRTHENDNKTISSGQILHVNLATRRDSAKYVCEAENIKGRGMAYTDIMVMYAPDINIQYENYTHVSKDRKLKCLPKGFPDMYTFYSWEHTSDYGDHIRFLSGTTDGRLLLPEITDSSKQYQDNGFYLCTATNGIADSTGQTNRSASVYLSITGIPVFVAENTNVVYGVVNEPAEITVSIFSNPKYADVIIKNKDGNRLLSNGIGMKLREQHMFVTDVIHTSRVRVKCYRTTFIITTLRSDMVQNYTVFVLNDYGNNRFQTSVLFASCPDTPLNVTVRSVAKYAIIDWTPNFNGGLKQNFFIEYRTQDSSVWKTVKTLNYTQNVRLSWNIQHLQAGFLYGFRMFARNRIGDSNRTDEIFVEIKNENAGFSSYIILSGSASLILVFIIVFTAYGIRRCLRRKIQINHCSTQTYKIEACQYDEIDEDQIIHVHDVEIAATDEIHVTDIDSYYEQPENLVIRQRSNSDQMNLPSVSSSESSENDIDENDTFTKDLILISYKQLTGDRSLPSPYDTLETVVN